MCFLVSQVADTDLAVVTGQTVVIVVAASIEAVADHVKEGKEIEADLEPNVAVVEIDGAEAEINVAGAEIDAAEVVMEKDIKTADVVVVEIDAVEAKTAGKSNHLSISH